MKTRLQPVVSAVLFALALNAIAVTRYVDLNSPSPTSPYISWTTAATNIQDAIDAAVDSDLVLVTNGIYRTGGRTVGTALITNRVAVTKPITLQSVNGPNWTTIEGYQVPGTVVGDSAIRCVYLTNGTALIGFTLTKGSTRTNSGSSNRNNGGGGLWCESTNTVISNCVILANSAYSVGGGAYNGTLIGCSLVNNTTSGSGGGARDSTLIRSEIRANTATVAGGGVSGGPNFASLYDCRLSDNSAMISGGADRSILSGCLVISNRSTAFGATGGGVGTSCSLTNCLLIGNSAFSGGAASSSTLFNCVVISNTATGNGGGLNNSLARNCAIIGNSAAGGGGGVFQGSLRNSIVYYNTASSTNINYSSVSELVYCCTVPFFSGVGNFTNEPAFIDFPNGNLHLQTNSPCVNSGNNAYVTTSADLDGRPRLVGGVVDIGPYELQSSNINALVSWLSDYGLPTHVSSDAADPDTDGMNNFGEWRSDTIPTNALSVLRMVSVTNSPTDADVTWQSVATRSYWLERSTNLGIASPFQTVATNIVGVDGSKTYTDTTATNGGPYFYRVGVQ